MCMLSNFSHVQCFATLWTVVHLTPLSMGFSRQECQSGLPCPSPEDLPDPGIQSVFPASPALAGGFFTTELSGKNIPSEYRIHILFNIFKDIRYTGLQNKSQYI